MFATSRRCRFVLDVLSLAKGLFQVSNFDLTQMNPKAILCWLNIITNRAIVRINMIVLIRAIRSCILQRTCSVDREQLEHVMGRFEKKNLIRRPGLTKNREGR